MSATVAGCAATLLGATGIALHFSRSDWRGFVVLAAVAPYLMSAATLGVVLLAIARQRIGMAIAACVVVAGVWTQAPLYIGDHSTETGPTITVMQANLLFDGADPQAFVDTIRTHNVDLLTVNELTPKAIEALTTAGLNALLPHSYLSPGRTATGTGIWSRHPLSDQVEHDGYVLNQLSATATIPGAGPLTIHAFHPVPPIYGTATWSNELSRLNRILQQDNPSRPSIVGGDFNATYDHTQFRAFLSARFHDATEQSGSGNLPTYPTDKWWPAIVGLDHILTANAHATSVQTLETPGSDHRALIAKIQLPAIQT
ncbi:endonuclease/exonuclease/phosphatase family protein [Nocardia sp. NPDC051030]|uniref:endonuclease/exonuclease/phosphatase family protein n=1 Tax=Nocardia sp. NPDC051030 TaxID=3155162 RepID=UPI00341CE244